MSKPFHLSVVATGRNDNHGGSFLYRMQHFVDGFIEQCKKHQLNAELIIVEWNPPEENEPLYKALKFPEDKGSCAIRFIRVPKEIHRKLKHSDQLQLFQMIAKNVGIRRALGEYVLATNIDILFSDALIQFMRNKLKANVLYRVDRLDVPSELPLNRPFNEILDFCAQNYFRINGKYGTLVKTNRNWSKSWPRMPKIRLNLNHWLYKIRPSQFIILPLKLIRALVLTPKKLLVHLKENFFFQANKIRAVFEILKSNIISWTKFLRYFVNRIRRRIAFKAHTNGCGDFTLLSYKDWDKLRGYPEWEIFSWHLDSVLLYQAKQMAIKEIDLKRKMAAYHIEHGFASGYTPEGHDALFQRIRDKGIPYLSNADLDAISFRAMKGKGPSVYNNEYWGLSEHTFEEVVI